MKKMADTKEGDVLDRIQQRLQNNSLAPREAWSCFSSPKGEYRFERRNAPDELMQFTPEEQDVLKSLKEKVKRRLERESVHRCAYCRRVMGNYHYSWQIEHILAKSKPAHKDLVFDMTNLALACIDCNYAKATKVDNIKRNYVFDIIHPKSIGFRYGDHLEFLHIATEEICLLKYQRISAEGANTYTKLKLHVWERAETLKSISATHTHLANQLDRLIGKYSNQGETVRVAQFLHKLKVDLLETRRQHRLNQAG